ncbi:MAG: hypothetical protein ABII12_03220 [Planctomycetota bacterium]
MNSDPKPGIKTTEFWATAGTIIASLMIAVCQPETVDKVAPWTETACVIAAGVAAGLYALSRGLAKRS